MLRSGVAVILHFYLFTVFSNTIIIVCLLPAWHAFNLEILKAEAGFPRLLSLSQAIEYSNRLSPRVSNVTLLQVNKVLRSKTYYQNTN